MKKALMLALCLGTLVSDVYAQDAEQSQASKSKSSKIYLRVGGGYAFAHAGQLEFDGKPISGSSNYSGTTTEFQSNFDYKKASFGAGANVVLAGGLMLQKHFGVELAVALGVAPKKYDFNDTYKQVDGSGTINEATKTAMYAKLPVMIMPSIVVQTSGQNMNVYSRVGLAIPIAGKIIVEQTETSQSGTSTASTEQKETETKNRMAIGLQGALGVQVKIGGKMKFYVEANGLALNAYAKEGSLTKDAIDGVDQLEAMQPSEKEFEYEFSNSETATPDPSSPAKKSTFVIPYSNIGIGLGIVVML